MSAGTRGATAPPAKRPAVTLSKLAEKKALGEPIVMVTAYDYPSAQVAEAAGVDVVLVGDSGAMTVLGYPSTVPVSLEEMLMLAAAARRGLTTPLLVGDMPFGSYEVSDEQAVASAQRFVKEAGCDAVKLERGGSSADRARAIVRAGIPVMGHVGLTPQTATALGGYRSQGRTAERALEVTHDALALEEAGCFAIVFEAVPSELTEAVVPRLEVPALDARDLAAIVQRLEKSGLKGLPPVQQLFETTRAYPGHIEHVVRYLLEGGKAEDTQISLPDLIAARLSMLTRLVAPLSRSWKKMSRKGLVSPPTRFVAKDWKATTRPSALIAGA